MRNLNQSWRRVTQACAVPRTILMAALIIVMPSMALLAQSPPVSNSSTLVKPESNIGSSSDLADKVARLLERLKDGTLEQRAEAEAGLLGLGPTILAHLPRLRSSDVGEYRTALDRIRDSMQSKAIGEYSKPSQINLQGKLPAGDVLLEIIDQTDNQLTVEHLPTQVIDVNFQKAGFWEALDFVLDELNYEVVASVQDGSLKLVPSKTAGNRASRAAYAGVFRLEATRVTAVRSLRAEQLNHMSLDIELMWEPRLRPVFFKFPMSQFLVECDNGEILQAANPQSSPEYTPTDTFSLDASLMTELPGREAKSIRRLSGTLVAAIPGAIVQLEFDELDKPGPKSQKVGNLSVTVEEMKLREDIYEFKVLIGLKEAGQTMDSFRGWLMSHEAYVLNADETRIENAGWQTYQMNSEAVGLTYYFDLGASLDGCRLVYAAPGAVTEQRIDFILKDIALP